MKCKFVGLIVMGLLLAACDGPTEPPIPKTGDRLAVSNDSHARTFQKTLGFEGNVQYVDKT